MISELKGISEIMIIYPVCERGSDLVVTRSHFIEGKSAKNGLQGHALSLPVSCYFREPVRLECMGRHQTHLCVIGRIRFVIGVGEAHPSWGLEVQHVGNLERTRRK